MVFQRIVVGNDGSPAAILALRLARRLAAPEARLLALTVAETHFATHAGMYAREWDQRLRADAESARQTGDRELRGVTGAEARTVTGHPARRLLTAADELGADLIALGSHGHSRAAGMMLGSVVTRLVHDAPCSVLVARDQPDIPDFPRSIVVGVDASQESLEARVLADSVAAGTGASIRRVTATGGKRLPDDATLPGERDPRPPVEALVDASTSADLVVVGHRGAHRLVGLGSVAERLAHRAACSVLVVRKSPVGAPRQPALAATGYRL